MRHERDFQTEFTRWAKHRFRGSGVFELKFARGPSLPFSALLPHQKDSLTAAKDGAIVYKIPDEGISQKPFDCFRFENTQAFVVVYFKGPAKRDFYLIDIATWTKEESSSNRRSLTEARAKEIGICERLA